MTRCSTIKANGERCKGTAVGPHGYCWSRDPQNAEKRSKMASRAALVSQLPPHYLKRGGGCIPIDQMLRHNAGWHHV